MYSYHIFYFPFKWEIKGRENLLFTDQTNLDNIEWEPDSNWIKNPGITDLKEQQELYNERNYYYKFVHPILYDTGKENSIVKHFKRKEPQQRDVSYIISKRGGKTYSLKIDAMNLNLYGSGVGMLTFYLLNNREDQKEPDDILTINQYGRRIFPPFYNDIEGKIETAEYLAIEGLNGSPEWYIEDFSSYKQYLLEKDWQPARFIQYLFEDLCGNMFVYPVIDDRMFVNCTYSCQNLVESFDSNAASNDGKQSEIENQKAYQEFCLENDFWYKYVFIDAKWPTCQNKKMRDGILEKNTYVRWQKNGTLYGFSRYSLVMLMGNINQYNDFLPIHMQTIYSRMVELVLIQRASTLRFSGEVTRLSQLSKENKIDKEVIEQIGSLYKEYIRFINQIHFREVTTQDQGIELYSLISETLKIKEYVESLDKEIEELYQYVNMLDDKIRNKNAEKLNIIAAIFLPATLLLAVFNLSMTGIDIKFHNCLSAIPLWGKLLWVLAGTVIMYGLLQLIRKNK